MKSFVAAFFLLLSLFLNTSQARTEISGFQDMNWGSTLQDLQQTKQLVLTKENDGSGGSLYALQNESLRFGKATLTGIHCSFVEGRLQGVILLYAGSKNYQGVKAEAVNRYGKPIQVDQKGGEMFTWPDDQTSIVLSYTKNSESGFLFLKTKKLPPLAKTPAAPQETTPPTPAPQQTEAVDDLALLDQASAPQRVAIEPSSGAIPGEPAPVPSDTASDGAAPIALISPEVQGLIDRDQALTRLCWDTVGPMADQACADMKENTRQLQELGWCMKPGEARDGLQVIWYRCDTGQTGAPSASVFSGPVTPEANPWQNPQPINSRSKTCGLVVELFAAAANMRDQGTEPQDAEGLLMQRQQGHLRQLPIDNIRETVELVYFDQQYKPLPLPELTRKVEEQCLSGQGPYIQALPQD